MNTLQVVDNDRDEISVRNGGGEIRAWSYSHGEERFWKMQMAREFVEGWYQAEKHFLAVVRAEKQDWRGSYGSLERIESAITDPSAGHMIPVCEDLRCDEEAAP